jgi:hypothetical protein
MTAVARSPGGGTTPAEVPLDVPLGVEGPIRERIARPGDAVASDRKLLRI